MSEEKDESLMGTIRAAVDEQKAGVEPGPQIAKPAEEEEPKEEESGEGTTEGTAEAEETKAEGDEPAKDKPEKPKEALQDETTKPDITRPPRRLPIRTKQRWLSIDPDVRADIWEREAAFDKAHARYDGLGQYAIKAEQNGTTLKDAMASYHAMETAIRQDPINGYAAVLSAAKIDPQIVFNEIYRRMGGGSGNGQQQPQPPPMQGPQGLTREELQAELSRQFQEREIGSMVAAFEADPNNHYLEPRGVEPAPIRDAMKALLGAGIVNNYKDAYAMACRANGLNPSALPNGDAASKGQAEKAAAVNRSRQAAKATIGAPSSGQKVDRAAPDSGENSILDTVRAAVRKQRG